MCPGTCADKLFSLAFCEHSWAIEVAHFPKGTTPFLNPRTANVLVPQVPALTTNSNRSQIGSMIYNVIWKSRWGSLQTIISVTLKVRIKSETWLLRLWVRSSWKTSMTLRYLVNLTNRKYQQIRWKTPKLDSILKLIRGWLRWLRIDK